MRPSILNKGFMISKGFNHSDTFMVDQSLLPSGPINIISTFRVSDIDGSRYLFSINSQKPLLSIESFQPPPDETTTNSSFRLINWASHELN